MTKPGISVAKILDSGVNLIQTCVVGLLCWVLVSVAGVKESVAVLDEQVKVLSITVSQLQVAVAATGDDRYRRADAERDFSKRDAAIADLQTQITENRDKLLTQR